MKKYKDFDELDQLFFDDVLEVMEKSMVGNRWNLWKLQRFSIDMKKTLFTFNTTHLFIGQILFMSSTSIVNVLYLIKVPSTDTIQNSLSEKYIKKDTLPMWNACPF